MLNICGLVLSLAALISAQEIPQDGDMTDFQPEIVPGDILKKGNTRFSHNDKFILDFRQDGFLAITFLGNIIWKVGDGRGQMLTLQKDGNLVLFDEDDNIVWQTNTKGSGIKAVLKSDGNLVLITRNNSVIWESGTAQKFVTENNGNERDKLFPGQRFFRRMLLHLVSENGKYILGFTGDGFFGIEDKNGKSLWKVGTGRVDNEFDKIALERDGNLELYSNQGISWQTNTKGSDVRHLQLRNDGNLVLETNNNSVIWESGTAQRPDSARRVMPVNWRRTATATTTTTQRTTTTTTTPVSAGNKGMEWFNKNWEDGNIAMVLPLAIDGLDDATKKLVMAHVRSNKRLGEAYALNKFVYNHSWEELIKKIAGNVKPNPRWG